MSQKAILIVDDEEDILELVQYNLSKEGFKVICAQSGELALQVIEKQQPDLVLLDLMLPGMNGLDVCRALKRNDLTARIPVLMLTAKGEESDIVAGLELGAEDYVTKPFSIRVLLARVRVALRRDSQEILDPKGSIQINGLFINPAKHEVKINDNAVVLTATEFKILNFLAKRRGLVFTRNQIVKSVHGADYPVTDRSVDVQIVGLRRKLGESGSHIETLRGVGYRFRE